ncbi:MAG TPA: hypothetical protein VF571_17020 [Pyrinomonadaceae bacterium]|jgi:hypothetical protein
MQNQEMKTKKNRTYLTAFVFVTVLNVMLAVYLLQISFAQINENRFKEQPPLKVEVVTQEDSPVRLTVINVDNSQQSFQAVNFSIQNISPKKIRAYVILHNDKSGAGKTSISFLERFTPGQITQDTFSEERVNIKKDGKLFLSLDYVEFDDGSVWGKDTQKQSEYIAGQNEGQKAAVNKFNLLIHQNKDAVIEFLRQPETEMDSLVTNNEKTDKWHRGFKNGYRTVLTRLQMAYEKQGQEGVFLKLREIEKIIKKEEK